MQYLLVLNQGKQYGQIPAIDEDGKIKCLILGRVNSVNHTLFLTTTSRKEIGRLFLERKKLITTYTIDVVDHSLVHVIKPNSIESLFYITRLNYWIHGNIKKGTYNFRSGTKKVASVKTTITKSGFSLICDIDRPEDVPFILLIAVLFTQYHVTPIELPNIMPNNPKWSTI